jgi:hypothetical protein
VIISKRQIGKALVFANIVPPREGLIVDALTVRDKLGCRVRLMREGIYTARDSDVDESSWI